MDRSMQLAASSDKNFVATTLTPDFQKSRIQVLDSQTLQVVGTTPDLQGIRKAMFGSNGKLLATVKGGLASFTRDFTQIDRQWTRPQIEGALQGSAHYPILERLDDNHYFVGDEDGWLSKLEWNDSPKALTTVKLGTAPLWSSALRHSEHILAVGDGSGVLYVLDTRTCQVLYQLPDAHLSRVTDLAWTDSGQLVSVGLDQSLIIWSWNRFKNALDGILKVRLHNNARQIIPLNSTNNRQELLLLHDGANLVEKIVISLPE